MKNRAKTESGTFLESEAGNTAILFAISAVGIAIVLGVAMDFSRAQNTRSSIQNAADAAVLAIARDKDVDQNNMQIRANDFFMANLDGQSFGTDFTILASEIQDGAGVQVSVTAEVDTALMGIIGVNRITVATLAEAMYSANKVELVLALDNTGSMAGNKIATLRDAANDLVDQLLPPGSSGENVKIGVVPFNYMVRLPTSYKTKSWFSWDYVSQNAWNGCVAPRKPPQDTKDTKPTSPSKKFKPLPGEQCPAEALTPLTNDADVLHTSIDNMEADNWTYIPEGLSWGWRVLSKKNPIADGVPYGEEDWTKILVLMTDGANTVRWDWPGGDPLANLGVASTEGDTATKLLCERIKDKEIVLYTIAFQIWDTSTRMMMEDCATDPSMYFDAENNADLEVAFAKITGDIINLRLSR